jgi:hypothetical protein
MTTAPARAAAARVAGLLSLLSLLSVLSWAPARAGATETAGSAVFAVIIGNNAGLPGEPVLRFAEEDAARIADVLGALGDFPRASMTLLQGRSAAEMRRAILDAEAALRRGGTDGLLFVYYSGHADGEALHLAGTTFPLRDLQELLGATDIATRVMVVDACRSGTLTQTKADAPAAILTCAWRHRPTRAAWPSSPPAPRARRLRSPTSCTRRSSRTISRPR